MAGRWRRQITNTIGLRLAAWYATIFAVSSIGVGLLAYQLIDASLVRRDHDLLRVKLAEYAARYESRGIRALQDAVSAEQASGGPDSVLVRLVGANADVLLVSAPHAWDTFDLGPLADSPGPGAEAWQALPSPTDTTTLEVASRRLSDDTLIEVGRTTIGRDRFLTEIRNLFGVLIAAVAAAGLAGGVAMTSQALRPLRSLRDTVRTITETGRFDSRVEAGPDGDLVDELGRLFNAMIDRIETLVDGMRGALDNVAHDLRTPIARLRVRAESALTPGTPPEATQAALADCVEEADRVISLLATLLDISEAETGTMRLTLDTVPVAALVAETIDLYEDTAEDRGVALTSAVSKDLQVRADRQRLRQVLANLVDNALKYTSAGGRVAIGAGRVGTDVRVTVEDTGSGIAPTDLPRIWDRLYRADSSRGEPGLGLGLSLVKAIVTAHGGHVDVTSEVGRGSTFAVTLPEAAAVTAK
jgi:signal transduction histidine kinase